MQKIKITILMMLISIIPFYTIAQSDDCLSQACFVDPIDLPLNLSAGFSEVRPNHFHAGLDIRTNRKTGFNVRAIADGYISRIAVKIGGYGNVIYITHPNGYMSIYAHLKSFNKDLADYVRKEQYKRKKFSVDLYLEKNKIKVNQGDIIALSGNTGSSGGPHLHFEIRDKGKSYVAINPLLLGYKTNDTINPTITKLVVYKADDDTNVNNTKEDYQIFNIVSDQANKKLFKIDKKEVIEVNGPIKLGISCFDMPNIGSLKTAPYSIDLIIDGKKIFGVHFARMSYYKQKMSNSYLDYGMYVSKKLIVHKSFLDKGNTLDNYSHVLNRGVINFTDDKVHKVNYIVKDIANNTSILEFLVQNNKNLNKIIPAQKEGIFFTYNKKHIVEHEDVKIEFNNDSFFDDIWFTYSKDKAPEKSFSDLHIVGNNLIALQKSYKLSIKPTVALPHPDKAIILNKNGGSVGGSYKDGYVTTHVGRFDAFYIYEDITAPTIIPSVINSKGATNDPNSVSFKISDNLSGIKSFNGYINDQWVLFEYEPKLRVISYYFDEHMPAGDAKLKIIVTDNKDNTNTYEELISRRNTK